MIGVATGESHVRMAHKTCSLRRFLGYYASELSPRMQMAILYLKSSQESEVVLVCRFRSDCGPV